jgi:hypothetical protein
VNKPGHLLTVPVLLLLLAALIAACGGGSDDELSVTGVVIDVQEQSLTQTQTFTLRSDAGEEVVFRIAPDLAPDQIEWFVPGHLQSILTTGEEVTVYYRDDGGALLAERMEHTVTPETTPY